MCASWENLRDIPSELFLGVPGSHRGGAVARADVERQRHFLLLGGGPHGLPHLVPDGGRAVEEVEQRALEPEAVLADAADLRGRGVGRVGGDVGDADETVRIVLAEPGDEVVVGLVGGGDHVRVLDAVLDETDAVDDLGGDVVDVQVLGSQLGIRRVRGLPPGRAHSPAPVVGHGLPAHPRPVPAHHRAVADPRGLAVHRVHVGDAVLQLRGSAGPEGVLVEIEEVHVSVSRDDSVAHDRSLRPSLLSQSPRPGKTARPALLCVIPDPLYVIPGLTRDTGVGVGRSAFPAEPPLGRVVGRAGRLHGQPKGSATLCSMARPARAGSSDMRPRPPAPP